MQQSEFKYKTYHSFEDKEISKEKWNVLLSKSKNDNLFLSWEWQSCWWKSWGRGKLFIITAESNDELITIAPLFEDQGMIFLVGSGWSDSLDFIGNTSIEVVLENILLIASEEASHFLGFHFYHLSQLSNTPQTISKFGPKLGWTLLNEAELVTPILDFTSEHLDFPTFLNKKSIIREENWFRKRGILNIQQTHNSDVILNLLPAFFNQDIDRRKGTLSESPFLLEVNKIFFKNICLDFSTNGWLRFSWIEWNKDYLAFHFGFNYKGSFLYWKPCYNNHYAKHSPGSILLKYLITDAFLHKAHTFDLGIGDESYKTRFSNKNRIIHNWGLYPT